MAIAALSPRAAVTPERIGEAALALLDQGPDESVLTMRSLGARLGVRAPSLYAHVSGIGEVLDLVHARINASIDVTVLDDAQTLAELAEFGRRYRDAYRAHPVAASIITSRSINRAHALRIYAPIADFLVRYRVPESLVMPVMAMFDNLVLGSAVQPFAAGFVGPARDYRRDYPALSMALAAAPRRSIDDHGFELGLRAFLDLIRSLVNADE